MAPLGKDWIYGRWVDNDTLVRCVGFREGGQWKSLPFHANVNSWASDIAQYGDTLYLGGHFDGVILDKDSSSIQGGNLLKVYHDSVWASPNLFVNLQDIEVSGDSIFISGSLFIHPDSSLVGPHVLSVDLDKTWNYAYSISHPGSLNGLGGPWDKLLVHGNDVFTINNAGDNPYDGVVRWDGQQWHTFGPGIYGTVSQVYDFVFFRNELVIGGSFTKAEDQRNPGERIAIWNGSSWQSLGGGSTSPVWSFFEHSGILYCHVRDSGFGDANIPSLAGWDGTQWCGTPIKYTDGAHPTTYGFINDTLFSFFKFLPATANGKSMAYLNYFDGDYVNGPNAICSTPGLDLKEQRVADLIELFPNPSKLQIRVALENHQIETVQVYDLNGRIILRHLYEGLESVDLDISMLPKGVYLIQVNESHNQRFVKN